jgi:hypothetical protein
VLTPVHGAEFRISRLKIELSPGRRRCILLEMVGNIFPDVPSLIGKPLNFYFCQTCGAGFLNASRRSAHGLFHYKENFNLLARF